jgi:hypothetical protein
MPVPNLRRVERAAPSYRHVEAPEPQRTIDDELEASA